MVERRMRNRDRPRYRYRIDGVRYVWVGVNNGEYSLFGDRSGGWNIADPDACAAEGVHWPRITEDFGVYCSRCGKANITFRDAFTSDEERYNVRLGERGSTEAHGRPRLE